MEKNVLSLEERFGFLARVYFGDITNIYDAIGGRAFMDLARTVKYKKRIQDNEKKKKKEQINKMIGEGLAGLHDLKNQKEFDAWHEKTCEQIIEIYKPLTITFNYGQAQKWVNMMSKYLLTIRYEEFKHLIPFFHIPIDNIILEIAEGILNINKPNTPWSQWNKDQYIGYRKELSLKVQDQFQIVWEYRNWSDKTSIKTKKSNSTNRNQKKKESVYQNQPSNRQNNIKYSTNKPKTTKNKKGKDLAFPLPQDSDLPVDSFTPFYKLTNRVYHSEFIIGYIVPLKDNTTNEEKLFMLFVARNKEENGYFCQIRYCYDRVNILTYKPFMEITSDTGNIRWKRPNNSLPTFKSVCFGENEKQDALCLMKNILIDLDAPKDIIDSIKCD